jgi:hypothetical protein
MGWEARTRLCFENLAACSHAVKAEHSDLLRFARHGDDVIVCSSARLGLIIDALNLVRPGSENSEC